MAFIPAFKIGIGNAWVFMATYALVLTVFMLASKKASAKTNITAPQKEMSRLALRFYEISFYISFIYSVFLPLQPGTAWFVTGLIIYLLGLAMCITAWMSFAITPIDQPVTRGIYSYSRHPIYLGLFLIFTGVGIASASWVFLLLTVVRTVSSSFMAIPEERWCLEHYGDAYGKYIGTTPRWLGIPKQAHL